MSTNTFPVSCAHMGWILSLRDVRHSLPGQVAHGSRYSKQYLLNDRNHIPWSEFSDLVTALEKFLSVDELRETGRRSWQSPLLDPYSGIARRMSDTSDMFLSVYGAGGFFSRHFPVEPTFEHLAVNHFRIDMRMSGNQPSCNALFTIIAGQMETLTTLTGREPAGVSLSILDDGASFSVMIPRAGLIRRTAVSLQRKITPVSWIDTQYILLLNRFEKLSREFLTFRNEHHIQQTDHQDIDPSSKDQITPFLSSFASSSQDGVICYDESLSITHVNPVAAVLFGYSPGELHGNSVKLLLPDTLPGNNLKQIYAAPGSSIAAMEVSGWHKSRTIVPVELSVSHVGNTSICVLRKVSHRVDARHEQDTLRTQLLAAQKMDAVGRLAGGIAHDFNNLLVAILGYADLAAQKTTPERLSHYLEEIRRAGERGTEITGRLLGFSRQHSSQPKLVEMNELVNGVREMIARFLPGNVEISLSCSPGPLHVLADPNQLEQVLVNLVVNARDAMPNGGVLSITTNTRHMDGNEKKILLEVSDTGMGMDESTRQKIFEPFYTSKPEGKGTGLGLSVVHNIIQQIDGEILVDSVLGSGTRFCILLPAANPDARPKSAGQVSTAPVGDETILVVEDNAQVRELARLILASAGYAVLQATDGADAITLFEEHQDAIDLILMDVVLPGTGGKDAAMHIRKLDPNVRILFTSGYSAEEAYMTFIRTEALAFLAKPYGSETLRRKVREVLDTPQDLASTHSHTRSATSSRAESGDKR